MESDGGNSASDNEVDTDKDKDAAADVNSEHRGIAVTFGNPSSINENLPSPVDHEADENENNRTAETEEDIIEALDNVIAVENTLAAVIAKRDMEYGPDYLGVKNQSFLAGKQFSGQRPKLQNIPSLSRGVAETLSLFRFSAGKLPGGSWNLTFPRMDGKPGVFRSVPNCKKESTFWDCLAQQVRFS
jgi:hypothetical protein